jgi:non-ribosomal peptide synthetase component F
VFPIALAQRFAELGSRHGFSYFDVCCAAYAVLLGALGNRTSVLTSFPFSLRSVLPQFRGTPGNMVDYVPLRIDFNAGDTALSVIHTVREAKREAIRNYLPVGYLMGRMGLEWQSNPTPLLQCLVNVLPSVPGSPPFLLNRPGDQTDFNLTKMRMVNLLGKAGVTLERQDVSLLAVNYQGELRFRMGARLDILPEDAVAGMQDTFARILRGMLERPDDRIDQSAVGMTVR